MFLLALALSPSFAATGCRISDVHLDLPLYIEISTSLAVLNIGPVPLGANPDPMFEDDFPIEYMLIPSAGTLTLMVTRQEARPTDTGVIDVVPISYTFIVDSNGFVRNENEAQRHACSTRLTIATAALAKMQETYHRAR